MKDSFKLLLSVETCFSIKYSDAENSFVGKLFGRKDFLGTNFQAEKLLLFFFAKYGKIAWLYAVNHLTSVSRTYFYLFLPFQVIGKMRLMIRKH